MHPDLRYAGMLPPLDAPHHMRASEWGPYREGVVREINTAGGGSFIDVGLDKVCSMQYAHRTLNLDFLNIFVPISIVPCYLEGHQHFTKQLCTIIYIFSRLYIYSY